MGIFSLQRVLSLQQAGCEVQVVSPLLMNPPPELIFKPGQFRNWIKMQSEVPAEMMFQGADVHYPRWIYPPKKIIGWQISHFQFLQTRNNVYKLAQTFHPDLILSSWLPDAIAGAKFAEKLKIPILSIADGTDVNVWPEQYRGWNTARKILNEKVSYLIYVSKALKNTGAEKGLFGQKSTVLHNAVDTNLFKPDPLRRDGKAHTIVGVGRFVRMKGFHVLIEAVSLIKDRLQKPLRIILVGDGPQFNELHQLASVRGISGSLEIVQSMQQEELVKIYQQADIFCLSSFSEGLPCVVIEAMACGVPVVASNVGGVSEIVDDNSGILIPPGDSQALAQALLQSIQIDWDRESIREKMIKNFSWQIWTKTLLSLIN
jgi:glycosyltransferase involved in cell wall biosynthesis